MFNDMDNSSEDDRRGLKRKIALASCDVCETEEAKYRCPSCMKHTCSLACVKRHKMLSGCCGVRDKTAFVPLAEFSEINLLSDYRFLEDTARLREQSHRDSVLLSSRRHPKESMWMIRKAKAVKVTLKLLPKMFSKHRENRTVFRSAEGRFHWHLKIHFPQSNAVYSERFPDNKQLDQILTDYIHPLESDPVKRQKLKVYVQSPQEDIRVFLKAEQKQPKSLSRGRLRDSNTTIKKHPHGWRTQGFPAEHWPKHHTASAGSPSSHSASWGHVFPRYLELDLRKSLQENLMHKTIVEYPEVFVVLKQHSQEFLAHIPERSRISPDRPHSQTPVAKRSKVIPEDDELEDGELRSEEEEAEDEAESKVKLHEDDVLEEVLDSGDAGAQDCTFSSQNIPGLPDRDANPVGQTCTSSSCDQSEANPHICADRVI
ncbi:box C/D snoRNA protein 1 isoform X1 [Pseudorasbora parva]|uniref:box C/D snoRNA protein 1 isoform X1 n=1 Tax=Pseudorasbora parva TaxID=51549 RepID=UPI00351E1A4B